MFVEAFPTMRTWLLCFLQAFASTRLLPPLSVLDHGNSLLLAARFVQAVLLRLNLALGSAVCCSHQERGYFRVEEPARRNPSAFLRSLHVAGT